MARVKLCKPCLWTALIGIGIRLQPLTTGPDHIGEMIAGMEQSIYQSTFRLQPTAAQIVKNRFEPMGKANQ